MQILKLLRKLQESQDECALWQKQNKTNKQTKKNSTCKDKYETASLITVVKEDTVLSKKHGKLSGICKTKSKRNHVSALYSS